MYFIMQVTSWPRRQYGEFYKGDSYIVLNTYQVPPSDVCPFIQIVCYIYKLHSENYGIMPWIACMLAIATVACKLTS